MDFKSLSVPQFSDLLKDPDIVVVDIRDKQSFETQHIPGAVAISDQVIGQLIRRKNKAQPVVVYCYHGISSRDICRLLVAAGLSQVYNLDGGWQGWMEANEKSAPILSNQVNRWLDQQGFESGNINGRIGNGMSPLMVAAKEGESEILWELLESGADVNLLNHDENSALWFACFNGEPGVIKMLIEYGAKLDSQNVNGATCLIYAASAGKFEVVKTLIEAGAEINATTFDGFNALDSAASLAVLRYLKPLYSSAACL